MSLGEKSTDKHFFREKSNSEIDANIIKNNGIHIYFNYWFIV